MRKILSAATCGFGVLAFPMATEHNFDGIELAPLKRNSIDRVRHLMERYSVQVTSVHAPFWCKTGYNFWREHGTPKEKLLAYGFGMVMGIIETNPAIEIAGNLGVPLNVHPGEMLEMRKQGILDKLADVRVRVENDDARTHPLTASHTNGIYAALEARKILDDNGISGGYTLDVAHLATEKKWQGSEGEYLGYLDEALGLFGNRLEAVHLLDFEPGAGGIKPGEVALGHGSLPLADIKARFVCFEQTSAQQLDLVLEVAPSMKAGATLIATGGRVGHGEVEQNVRTSLEVWNRV